MGHRYRYRSAAPKSLNRRFLALTAAAAAGCLVPAAPARAQVDNFQFFFDYNTSQGGTNNLGGFDYDDGNNVFWTAGFGGAAQAIRRISNSGGTWTGTPYAGGTDWVDKFLKSSSLTDNGGNGTILPSHYTSLSVVGDLQLNPQPVTLGGTAYAAHSIAIVLDQSSVRNTDLPTSEQVQSQFSKLLYAYDLRQIGSAAAGGSRDINGNGIVDWNDAFVPLMTLNELQAAQGAASTASAAVSRRFAFSSSGQSIYFNDSGSTFGGIWKRELTGAATLTKIVDARNAERINTEPAVVPSTLRNFGGGTGDQIVFQGGADTGNDRGVSFVVDDGTTVSAPQALLTAKQLAGFFDHAAAAPDVSGVTVDSAGNLYLTQASTPTGVFVYDTAGRLAKIFSNAEQRVFERANGATGHTTGILDTKVREVSVDLPGGGSAVLPQVLFSDSSVGLRAPLAATAFKVGDFNRDNLVDASDATLFKSALGLRGQVVASIGTSSPFTQANTANLKFDLNGSVTASNIAGVAIDWKDVKIFQQFAGLSDGDVDMDFDVDASDLDALAANYNGTGKLFTHGNLTSVRIAAADRDDVNFADLVTLAANWTAAKPALGAIGSVPQVDLDRAFAITANGAISQYQGKGGADAWSNAASWSGAGVPNSAGAVASLLTKPQDDTTINVDGNFTVGQLNFDNYFSYTLDGAGTLTLDGGGGATAEVNAFAASPTIAVNLALHSDTNFTVNDAADTALVSGEISGAGDLIKSGAGVLRPTAANTYTGSSIVNGGILAAERPAVLPGWNVAGKATVNSSGTLAVNVGGAGGWIASQIDTLRGSASFNAGSGLGFDTSNAGVNFTYGSDIDGLQGLTKLGANTLTLSGTNTYAGATAVVAGALEVTSAAALPGFDAAGKVSVAAGTSLIVRAGGSGWTDPQLQALLANATFEAGPTATTGATLGVDTTPAGAAGFTYANVIPGAGIGVTKLGANTLSLTRANTYTGPTTVAGGTLQLDFSAAAAPVANILHTATPLRMAGGTLLLTGKASTSNTQTVAGVTIAPGSSYVVLDADASNPLRLTLGSMSRSVGGTLDVTPPAGTQDASNGVTTTTTIPSSGNGIFGGHLTVARTDWGTRSGAGAVPIVPLDPAAYTADAWGGGTNTTVTASTAPGASSTTNSLRFNVAAANTVTLDGANTITSGGILVTPNVAANDATITGGMLAGRSGADLVIHQHNAAGQLHIASDLIDNPSNPSGLTKSGAGRLTLSGTLSYTGPTTINEGLAALQTNLTASSSLSINGGTLELASGGGAARVISTPALSVSGTGTIDLKDNKLIASGDPIGNWNGYAYTGVAGLIDAGRGDAGDAQWDGSGIVTSDPRAIDTGNLASLGVASASQLDLTSFGGVSVGGDDVLVMFTYGGDANLDGKINIDDYGRIDSNVAAPGANGWFNGDFNYDGKINIDDYGIIDTNIAQQSQFPLAAGTAAASVAAQGIAAVPEPGAAALWLLAAGAGIARRARRRA